MAVSYTHLDVYKRQILWRAEGSPKMEYSEKFADVAEGQWYTDAVLWANENCLLYTSRCV